MNPSLLFPALAALAATATAVYMCRVRPWQLTWGATDEEVARTLPADDLVPFGTVNATRPVTIAAAPEETWPWSLQVGVTRAG